MFEKMVQIDTDPNSQRSKDYYKALEEIERSNKNKKPTQILIKTMRRGRMVNSESKELGEDGKPLSPEEMVTRRKFTDFAAVKFPEVNPISLKVTDAQDPKKEIHLQSYRYKSTVGEAKATV